ncbi:LysR family transcriptional regulator [Psychromonas sp. 14N.309.X.WAT.B.A12]|uniref:LysR family transcriptional regulator n=1 Tax=unclassified Psychromonas TaxID=2614957 RepID=UPI0025AF6408|nr:LysR family transcriptional regulator [Psychromonas sp. 14N.309.X.WAT.B.A12]MDN2663213.1 LysR family transcriptional regulator [Psychromonas sp. 14N.309.X.WAT.B.A12]
MGMSTRLDLFLDVVQHGSFAKAAGVRNIDRSALSKQIKILEDDLGVRLLNRSTRALSLTDAGKEILKQAESVRELLANTQRLAESYHSTPKGLLRVTSPSLFGKMYIQDAVTQFMAEYPETHIKLVLEDRRADIIGERFDIAFRIGPPRDSSLIARKLANNNTAILASQHFIDTYGEPTTPEELVKLPAIIYSNGEITANKLIISDKPNSEQMETHVLSGRLEVNELSVLMDAVEAGLGFSQRSLFALDKNIKEKGLVPLLTNYKLPETNWGLYAVYPHRNQTPLVKLFIDTVQKMIGTPPIWESYIDDYKEMYK